MNSLSLPLSHLFDVVTLLNLHPLRAQHVQGALLQKQGDDYLGLQGRVILVPLCNEINKQLLWWLVWNLDNIKQ